jgi:hypothetical protein
MPLITDAQREQLLANGRAQVQGRAGDPLPVVRLFTPDAHATAATGVALPGYGWHCDRRRAGDGHQVGSSG